MEVKVDKARAFVFPVFLTIVSLVILGLAALFAAVALGYDDTGNGTRIFAAADAIIGAIASFYYFSWAHEEFEKRRGVK